ncbi:unnamed protein product [Tilletia controversa]|nr:unnamed protein product [Tilletia controversa]
MPAAAAASTGSSIKNKNTANGETPSNNNDALTTTTANAPAPTLRAINPFLHIYDPTALPEDATTTDKSKTAHIPSLLPGVRAPAVILLFGFMDGPLRIMSKYVNQYTARFPTSTLLLQLSTSKSFFISQEERSARMRKIVQLVERAQERALARRDLRRKIREIEGTRGERSLDSEEQREVRRLKALQIKAMSGSQLNVAASGVGGESLSISKMGAFEEGEDGEDAEESDLAPELRTPRGLLIHSFSDGGARNLWALLNELSPSSSSSSSSSSSLRSPNARLPPLRTLILDSSPGYQTASTSALALTIPLQKKYAAWIVFLVRAGVWAYIRVALAWRMYVRRLPTDSERMRAALNSPGKWGWGWASASASSDNEEGQWKLPPRLYLYSRADVLIPWKQVERHARDAARIQVDDTHANPERIEQESGELEKQEKSALQAAARAGTVDPEMAKWAELSAKFETSFSKSREGSTTDTGAGAVVRKEETGVRLVRWEKAAHCDLGRHDLLGYWRSVDAWLARV